MIYMGQRLCQECKSGRRATFLNYVRESPGCGRNTRQRAHQRRDSGEGNIRDSRHPKNGLAQNL